MLPSSNQLVADAMRELAESHREWTASCHRDVPDAASDRAYDRLKAAEERVLELALSLYPGSPTSGTAPRRARRAAARAVES